MNKRIVMVVCITALQGVIALLQEMVLKRS